MHRILEKLDSLASTLVPLLYLAGLALGAAAYFSGVVPDAGAGVGIGLATAAELHSFLQQRRLRAAWGAFQREAPGTVERDRLAGQLWVHGGILAALLLFSTYNSIAFVAETWRPAPGFLPDWLQVGIRGSVIPAFFFLSGFLAPLAADAGALLASAAHSMLHTTIKATVKQWRRRIRRAQKRGVDLAPVAVALMIDAGDTVGARRIRMIAAGLAHAEAGGATGEAYHLPALEAPALTPASLSTLASAPPFELTPGNVGNAGADSTPDDTPPAPTGGRPRRGSARASSSASNPLSAPGSLRLVSNTGAGGASHASQASHARIDSGMTREQQAALWERDTRIARGILASEPDISTRELARRLSVGRIYTCHPQRASTIRRSLAGVAASSPRRQAQG